VKFAEVRVGSEQIGIIGTVHPHLARAFDLPESAFFEIDFERLARLFQPWGAFESISTYPEIIEDYSFVLPQTRSLADLIFEIRAASPLVREIELKDRFETKSGERSITLRITFQSPEKSLSAEDVKPIREKINRVIQKSGGTIRD